MKSVDTEDPRVFDCHFVNYFDYPLDVFWIDYEGKLQHKGTLEVDDATKGTFKFKHRRGWAWMI